ncbi:uncharacterized protein LOC108672191, partial [Hyalella azteca]|uniref:Uncharacterized protein LOC108672191 n=1 Tax=Hyalella azteca TaxID=294128 RepID=A0A8B7NNP1_HYAAZ
MRVLLMIIGCTLFPLTYARDTQPGYAAWASCETTVCQRVQDEAEGMARVKLLRSYVYETVRLLDSLMESMDNELIQIAEEMKTFVGSRCQSAHGILASVIEKRPRSDAEGLSAGIMEESTAQFDAKEETDVSNGIESAGQSAWSVPDSWSWTTSQEHDEDEDVPVLQSSTSNKEGYEQQTSDWQVSENELTSRISSDRLDQQLGGSVQQANTGDGTGSVWQPMRGPSTNKGRQGHERKEDLSTSASQNQVSTSQFQRYGNNCRGLPGSPFAVPGIDSWCDVNCSR